jgi:uncharacterized integral membrane protein
MRYIVIIVALALSVLLVIFSVQNTQPVEVQFFTQRTGQVPLSIVVVLTAIAGASLTGLLALSASIQRAFQKRKANRERQLLEARATELEQRVDQLEKLMTSAGVPVPSRPGARTSTRR